MKIILNVQELHIHIAGGEAGITLLERIMTTQNEIATTLDGVTAQLVATREGVTAQLAKIGAETQTLLTKIEDLTAAVEAAGGATPEVEAALQALQSQAQELQQVLQSQAQSVDDLVKDAAP